MKITIFRVHAPSNSLGAICSFEPNLAERNDDDAPGASHPENGAFSALFLLDAFPRLMLSNHLLGGAAFFPTPPCTRIFVNAKIRILAMSHIFAHKHFFRIPAEWVSLTRNPFTW